MFTLKVKPFHGARIHFLGFAEGERAHMASELERNGGQGRRRKRLHFASI